MAWVASRTIATRRFKMMRRLIEMIQLKYLIRLVIKCCVKTTVRMTRSVEMS